MKNNSNKKKSFVLDSHALLAYFADEKGRETVEKVLEDASSDDVLLRMTVINLGEVIYIAERKRGIHAAQLTLSRIRELPIKLVDIDEDLVLAAAHIKAEHSISYADCFAAALSIQHRSILLTGDPEFKKIKKDIEIYWL
ncbi:type II toxin-antitoxin system VapC family toxin [Actinomycetota bacterium]